MDDNKTEEQVPAWRLGDSELRGELGVAIGGLRAEMHGLGSELRAEMAELKGAINLGVKVLFAGLATTIAGVVAVSVAVGKYLLGG